MRFIEPPVILGTPGSYVKDMASVMQFGMNVLQDMLFGPEAVRLREEYKMAFLAKGGTEEEYKKKQFAAELVFMEGYYKSLGVDTGKIFTPEIMSATGMDALLEETRGKQ